MQEFHLINYTKALYPEITTFKYPKVGQTNSACRVGRESAVQGGKTRWFDVIGDPRNHYIPRMDWVANPQRIVFQHLNRLQNRNRVMLANPRNGRSHTILTEQDEAWVDVHDDMTWLKDGSAFTWLSDRDGWRHLYLVSRSGREITLLTPGEFDVIDVVGIDQANQCIYYIASPENPTQRYLYRASLDGIGAVGKNRLTVRTEHMVSSLTRREMGDPYVLFHQPTSCHRSHPSAGPRERASAGGQCGTPHIKLSTLNKCPTELFRVDIGDGVYWMDGA